MEDEITDNNKESAKSTLTTIVKFNAAICAIFAAVWVIAALMHQHASPVAGLFGVGALLALLTTISALNARLRVEWEEPDSAK
jgi:hypothetical protein